MRPIYEIIVPCTGIMYSMDIMTDEWGNLIPKVSQEAQDILGEVVFELISGYTYDQIVHNMSPILDDLNVDEQSVMGDYMSEIAIALGGEHIGPDAYQRVLGDVFARYQRDLRNRIRLLDPNTLGLLFYR